MARRTHEFGSGTVPLERERGPVFARLGYDDQCLYVSLNFVTFDVSKLRDGTVWGQDDGAEIALGGKTTKGEPVTFVLRGYPGGKLESLGNARASAAHAKRFGEAARFAAKPYGKIRGGWKGEWSIPWQALGLKPEAGLKIPFNMTVYRSADNVWRCWEGTLGQSWKLDRAGTLQLK